MAKKPIGWLTRDKGGMVCFWVGKKPTKEVKHGGYWDESSDAAIMGIELGKLDQLVMVKWSDEKPRAVEDFILLGEAE